MPRYTFDKVSLQGSRTVVVDGKKRRQTKKFWQTVNPLNKAADGQPKTVAQIFDELREERRQWEAGTNE